MKTMIFFAYLLASIQGDFSEPSVDEKIFGDQYKSDDLNINDVVKVDFYDNI